jgi:hypothetical protein
MAAPIRNLTPAAPQRTPVPAAPDSTRKPSPLVNPGTSHPHPHLQPHTRPAVLTGPSTWENGRDPVSTPTGSPPFAQASAGDVDPC